MQCISSISTVSIVINIFINIISALPIFTLNIIIIVTFIIIIILIIVLLLIIIVQCPGDWTCDKDQRHWHLEDNLYIYIPSWRNDDDHVHYGHDDHDVFDENDAHDGND